MATSPSTSSTSILNIPKLLQKKNGVKNCLNHYNKLVQNLVNASSKKLEMQQKETEKYSTILNSAFSLNAGSAPSVIQQEIMNEVINTKFFFNSLAAFRLLAFETRKHVTNIFITRISWNYEEFDTNKSYAYQITELLNMIITQIIEEENENIVMHLHSMLNAYFNNKYMCKIVSESSLFIGITKNFYNPSFMMKTSSFSSMIKFLCQNYDFISGWTVKYFPKLNAIITDLIDSDEFVTRIQLLKLLRIVMTNNSLFREKFQENMSVYKKIIWIFSKNKKDKIAEETLHLIKTYFDNPEALYYLKRNYESHILKAIKNNLKPEDAEKYIDSLQNAFSNHSKSIKSFETSNN